MKKKLLFLVLIFALIMPALALSEEVDSEQGLLNLISESQMPKVLGMSFEYEQEPEGEENELIYENAVKGKTMRVTLRYKEPGQDSNKQAFEEAINKKFASVTEFYEVKAALNTLSALAKSVSNGESILSVEVIYPYYRNLVEGCKGDDVKLLQEKLIALGFMEGTADGDFGAITKGAVKNLQEYIKRVETYTYTKKAQEEAEKANATVPEPSTTPKPVSVQEPLTKVTGQCTQLLQAYFLSDDFPAALNEIRPSNAYDDDALRMQRRLKSLGCFSAKADGFYGDKSFQGVRVFQYVNEIEMTGIADVDTLKLLFSNDAKAAKNPSLSFGSTGDEVRKLQKRLNILGFSVCGVDGDYGTGTRDGVKCLQEYFRDIETENLKVAKQLELTEKNGTTAPNDPTGETPEISADIEIDEDEIQTKVNGIADTILLDSFYAADFTEIPAPMKQDATGREVVRVQRRLRYLSYFYELIDGQYGKYTVEAVTKFQKQNDLPETGECDEETLKLLFSDKAKASPLPYLIKVSTDDQRVYIYKGDGNGNYNDLIHTMRCSTGKNATPTPKGTYQSGTGRGARWHYFTKFNCWAQYAFYIDGDIMFHSVLYNERGGSIQQGSVNALGRKASHGCVRLSVEDAKWIYNNCPKHTKVIVY